MPRRQCYLPDDRKEAWKRELLQGKIFRFALTLGLPDGLASVHKAFRQIVWQGCFSILRAEEEIPAIASSKIRWTCHAISGVVFMARYSCLKQLIDHSASSRAYFLSLPVSLQIKLHAQGEHIRSAQDLHRYAEYHAR